MSRCYPYPPPGYEKKAYVEPPLSPKKEKRKHKDKKKKRRRDKETNGDARPPDKDKRPKRNHRTGDAEDIPNLANGNLPPRQASMPAAVHENAAQILQASRKQDRMPVDVHIPTRKGLELSYMVEPTSLTSVRSGNGAAVTDLVPSSSKVASKIEDELSRKRRAEFMPHVEKVWSAVDDQEWLFLCDNQLQIRQKETVKDESVQVWSEATLLPSVEIYALPYVVLD